MVYNTITSISYNFASLFQNLNNCFPTWAENTCRKCTHVSRDSYIRSWWLHLTYSFRELCWISTRWVLSSNWKVGWFISASSTSATHVYVSFLICTFYRISLCFNYYFTHRIYPSYKVHCFIYTFDLIWFPINYHIGMLDPGMFYFHFFICHRHPLPTNMQ